jgi:two-component system LytT family response regulator
LTVRVLIADDEPLARERVRELLGNRDLEVVGEARDGEEALRLIQSLKPDLIFLDVQMPALDGFEVLAELRADERPAVIFVTAYDDYAVRAFEVDALDYLVKPFNRARFDAALQRALSRKPPAAEQLRALLDRLQPGRKYATRFVIRTAEEIHFVRVDDVLWLESAGNYVKLHTAAAEHLLRGTIRELEERLDPERFVRVHRSAIVSVDAIEKLEPYFHGELVITLRGGARLTSSRSYSARLRELLR